MTEPGTNETLHVHVAPDGAIVASGDIDVAGGPILDATIVEQEATVGGRAIVIDLTDVTFIDSSGLRSLLAASRRAEERSSVIVLRSPSASVQRLLEITGTTAQFEIAPGS